eukprot:17735-Hanusia_phi.AAC.1
MQWWYHVPGAGHHRMSEPLNNRDWPGRQAFPRIGSDRHSSCQATVVRVRSRNFGSDTTERPGLS